MQRETDELERELRHVRRRRLSSNSKLITCSRAHQPLDSLLSMSMLEGETLKTYSDRYWEMYNEIDGDFNDMTISIFKVSLPVEHNLRKSLTGKPVTSVQASPPH